MRVHPFLIQEVSINCLLITEPAPAIIYKTLRLFRETFSMCTWIRTFASRILPTNTKTYLIASYSWLAINPSIGLVYHHHHHQSIINQWCHQFLFSHLLLSPGGSELCCRRRCFTNFWVSEFMAIEYQFIVLSLRWVAPSATRSESLAPSNPTINKITGKLYANRASGTVNG